MMKRVIAFLLSISCILSLCALSGCGTKKQMKLGIGLHSYIESTSSANEGSYGMARAMVAVAAVVFDADGKILKCSLDLCENPLRYSSAGKPVKSSDLLSDYQKGDKLEINTTETENKQWYKQADLFAGLVVGKTVSEVSDLVVNDSYGNEEVLKAGCYIEIADFAIAINKAVSYSVSLDQVKNFKLALGVQQSQVSGTAATAEKNGKNTFETSAVGMVLTKGGKVLSAFSDVSRVFVNFDQTGTCTSSAGNAISSKRQLGTNYGTATSSNDRNQDGVIKEWYEQADVFDAMLIGKKASAIKKMVNEKGYGSDELQKAGCTVYVSDMVKAAVKAAEKS